MWLLRAGPVGSTGDSRTLVVGIRTALGARPSSIVSSIAKRAFAQLVVGVAIGAVASAFPMTSDPTPDDIVLRAGTWPVVISLIALGMIAVGMLACVSPTRRGLRIRPVEALKG